MKKLLFLIFFLSISIIFVQGRDVSFPSGGQGGIVVCSKPPCSWGDFVRSLENLIRTVVIISFWLAFLAVAIGAFLIMFGGLFPKWYERGRSMILIAIIAYAFILFSGIIFDFILEFFEPQFKTTLNFGPQIVLAQTTKVTLTPKTFYDPLRDALQSSLKCGKSPEKITGIKSLDRLLACAIEVANLLKNVALILLVFAIIASAFYLISAPIRGFKQIVKAKDILIWSIIGFIIVLLADIIREQIKRIVGP
jgi:hypothetical protein